MEQVGEILIDFLNDIYDEAIESKIYSNHELEIIRKFLDNEIEKIRNKEA